MNSFLFYIFQNRGKDFSLICQMKRRVVDKFGQNLFSTEGEIQLWCLCAGEVYYHYRKLFWVSFQAMDIDLHEVQYLSWSIFFTQSCIIRTFIFLFSALLFSPEQCLVLLVTVLVNLFLSPLSCSYSFSPFYHFINFYTIFQCAHLLTLSSRFFPIP